MRKNNGSLSAKTSLLFIAGIAVFSITLIIILQVSSSRFLQNWQKQETENMYEYVEESLLNLAEVSTAQNKAVTNSDITQTFQNIPFEPNWLYITDEHKTLLYMYRTNGFGRQYRNLMMMRTQDIHDWRKVTSGDGQILFYYSIGVPEFTERTSNDTLLKSFRLALVLACLVSCILAFLASQLLSGKIKRQTASLVSLLESIAKGKRDTVIPDTAVKEFSQIAAAASTLQTSLLQEESLRRQWASDIAHDLRTPLTVLQGTIEGIIDGVFQPDAQKMNLLNSQVKHLSSLVNALSLLTKLETPGYELRCETVAVHEVVSNLITAFSSHTEEKKLTFTLNTGGECIEADPVLFERLLTNLLSNAVDYSLPGTLIKIQSGKKSGSGMVFLSVSNYAELSDETVSRAFDRLYQGNTARNDKHSGLGLSIVQAIVKAHGWNISLEYNKSEKLVTFTVIFIKSL